MGWILYFYFEEWGNNNTYPNIEVEMGKLYVFVQGVIAIIAIYLGLLLLLILCGEG